MRLKTFPVNVNYCIPARVLFFATTPEKPQPVEQKAENVDQLIDQLKTELNKNENALDQKRADVLQIFQKFQTENQNGKLKNEAGTFMLKVALKLQNIEGKANYGAYKKMSAADKAKIEGTMQNIRRILEGKNSQGENIKDDVTTATKIEADRQKVLVDYGEAKSMSAAERFAAQKLVNPVIDQKSAEPVQVPRTEQPAQKDNVPDVATNQTTVSEAYPTETNQQAAVAAEKAAEAVAATIQLSQNAMKSAEKENLPSQSSPTAAAEIPTSSFGPRVQIDSREIAQPTPTGVELKKELTDQQIAYAVERLFNNPGRIIATLPDKSTLVKVVETDVNEDDRGQASENAYQAAEDKASAFLNGKNSAGEKLARITRFDPRFENGTLTVIIRVPPQTIGEEVVARELTKPEPKNPEFSDKEIETLAKKLAENSNPKLKIIELPGGNFLVKGTYRNLSRVRIMDRENAEMFAMADAKRSANIYLDQIASSENIHITPHGGTFSAAEDNLDRELIFEQREIPNSFDFETKTATVVLFVPSQSIEKKIEPTTIP